MRALGDGYRALAVHLLTQKTAIPMHITDTTSCTVQQFPVQKIPRAIPPSRCRHAQSIGKEHPICTDSCVGKVKPGDCSGTREGEVTTCAGRTCDPTLRMPPSRPRHLTTRTYDLQLSSTNCDSCREAATVPRVLVTRGKNATVQASVKSWSRLAGRPGRPACPNR